MSLPESTDRLDRAIAALKAQTSSETAPARVDRAIASAIARAGRPRPRIALRWPAWAWLLAPTAVAATAALVIAHRASVHDAAGTTNVDAATATATSTQFMPVVSIAELERSDNALIVPARLPRMTLAELGLPVNPARAADAIDAELLVRRDGTLLAVRFTD